MKVTFIVGTNINKQNGATIHVKNLVRALESNGVSVNLNGFEDDKSGLRAILWSLAAPFKVSKENDAVIVRSGQALPIILLARLRGFKAILSLAALKQQESSGWMKPFYRIIEALSIRASNAVITISPQLKAYSENHGASKVLVYPLCMDWKLLSKTKYKKASNAFTIGYAGTSGKWEGLEMLLETMDLLKKEKIDLQVYGKIDEHYQQKFKANHRIKFFGPIPNAEMPEKEKSFDLFIIPRPHSPTADTTTPIKLVEAMAVGAAILSTDVGGTAWLLEDKKNALVCKATPQALADSIRYAKKNPGLLWKLRKQAQQNIRTADYSIVGKNLKALIGSLKKS